MSFRALSVPAVDLSNQVVEPRDIPRGLLAYAPHDWSSPFEVETSWDSDSVDSLYSDFRQSVLRRLKPVRSFGGTHYSLRSNREDYLSQFVGRTSPPVAFPSVSDQFLVHGTEAYWQYGIECDLVCVEDVVSGVPQGEFAFRRFFEGQRIFILNRDFSPLTVQGFPVPAVQATIVSVTAFNAVISSPIPFEKGMRILPAVDCIPADDMDAEYLSGSVATAEIDAQEAPGISALPSSETLGAIPAGVQSHVGRLDLASGTARPVLRDEHNWRDGATVEFTRRSLIEREGSRLAGAAPKQVWPVTVSSALRRQWYQLLQFYDSVGGGSVPFWAVLPKPINGPVSRGASGGSLKFQPQGELQEFLSQTKAVAFLRPNNQYSIHELITPGVGGDDWDITVYPDVPDFPISCMKRAALVRFRGAFSESWISLEKCDVEFQIIEADPAQDLGVVTP